MRIGSWPLVAAFLTVFLSLPASADDWPACGGSAAADAVSSCTRIIESNTEPPQNMALAYFNRGSAYFKMGKADLALADLTKSITLDPGLEDAYFNRGLLYINQGAYQPAFVDLDRIAAKNPSYPKVFFYRGYAAHALGDAKGAIADYDEHLKDNPTDAQGYFNRGVAYDDLKDDARALADYSQAISLVPGYVDALINRGALYRRSKDYEAALSDFDRAAGADPQRAEVFVNRAAVRADKGDVNEAIADYRRVLDLAPPDNMAKAAKDALSLLEAKPGFFDTVAKDAAEPAKGCGAVDSETSIRDCTQVIAEGKGTPLELAKAFHNRGVAYADQGRQDEAIDDYTSAIKLSPDFDLPYYARGNAHYAKEKNDSALKDYDKYISLNPNDSRGYSARGLTLREKGRCKKAIPDFDQAVKLNPKDDVGYSGRGECYSDQRYYNQAVDDFDQSLALDPADPITTRERGYAQEQRGDRVKAAADYEKALTLNPSKRTARLAHEGLARIAAAEPKATDRDFRDCGSDNVERILRGCSNVIEASTASSRDRAKAYVTRGLRYGLRKEYQRALSDFTDAISTDSALAAAAYANRGITYAEMNNLELAIKDFDAAINLEPRDATNYTNRGQALESGGRSSEALADFERALGLSPDPATAAKASDGIARLKAAFAAAQDATTQACVGENTQTAFDACSKVIESGSYPPKYVAQACINRAIIFRLRNEPLQAIADYETSIKNDPTYAVAYANRGGTRVAMGQHDKAFEDFNRAIELDSTYGFAYAHRGLQWENRGDYAKADADFKKALALNPSALTAEIVNDYYRRLSIKKPQASDGNPEDCFVGDVDLAFKGCKELIQRGYFPPKTVSEAHFRLGGNYWKRNDLAMAIQELNASLSIEPWNAEHLTMRGFLRVQAGQHVGAGEDLRLAAQIVPNDKEVHSLLADALSGTGDLRNAIAEYSKALDLTPQSPEDACKRGQLYEKIAEPEAALKDYKAALAMKPSPAWDDLCKSGIERITGKHYEDGQN